MRQLLISTALLLAVPTFGAAQGSTCPDGTMTCNIATVGDTDISAPQTIGDTVNPTYSPDSASANASTGAIDVDNIVQGDTITTEATGNTSTNDNRSSANNSGSANVTGGNINATGGNITSSADTTGGNIDSTATTTSGPATTVGGNAVTASGPASTNSGSITSSGGAGGASSSESSIAGSGNSASDSRATGGRATGGNSRAVTGASTSRATGGAGGRATGGSSRSSSGGNTISGGNSTTNVDASQRTTIRHAANTAAMINSQGYGGQNCLGDTNPSGQFGASIQTFGWGVTANSMKASNVCAMLKIGGERAALAYLAGMDPNARRALLNNGMAVTIAQVEAQARAEAEAERQQQRRASAQKLACPSGYDLTARQDGSMTCRLVEIDQTPRQVAPPMLPAGASCPAGSRWDGKGCWMPRQ